MSSFSGPEISNDGLVFYYDMNNTEKSWGGKPTTNNAANGKVDYYSRWGTTTNFPPLPFTQKTDVYELTNGNNYFGASSNFDITNGNTYTVSYWYYISTTEVMQHFMRPLTSGYATAATENATNFVNTNNTNSVSGNINGWVWGYKTFTVTTAPTYMRGTYTTGSGDGNPTGKMYITNVMIEPGSTPSGPYGYTGSTRSNTQAILDLTNNNTITIQNLSYASNGTFSFDGTDDHLLLNQNIFTNSLPNFTISAWINKSTDGIILGNHFGGSTWESFWLASNNFSVNGANDSTTNRQTLSFSISNNAWVNVCAISNNTSQTMKVYANGIEIASKSANVIPWNSSILPSIGAYVLAPSAGGGIAYALVGTISHIQVYNRALSAQEVAQNFQALRGRYGL
jgi:hypothetical protein